MQAKKTTMDYIMERSINMPEKQVINMLAKKYGIKSSDIKRIKIPKGLELKLV